MLKGAGAFEVWGGFGFLGHSVSTFVLSESPTIADFTRVPPKPYAPKGRDPQLESSRGGTCNSPADRSGGGEMTCHPSGVTSTARA
jgi:hypothetical protein